MQKITHLSSKGLYKLFPYLSLALIVFLYMLPRIRSAQFGLLDDGVTLIVGQKFLSDPSTPFKFMRFSGRFFPIYWLYQSLVFQFAKYAAYRWFIANTILLFALSIILYKVTYKFTKDIKSAWLASVLFIFSGPVVESFYTITKSEPIMLFFVCAAVMVSFLLEKPPGVLKKILVVSAITLLFFCAYASKETAMVMTGICAGWLGLTIIFKGKRATRNELSPTFWLFLASVAAVGIYFAVRQAFHTAPLAEGGYTTSYRLELSVIVNQLLSWLGRFLRDDFYILPLVLTMVLPKVRQKVNLKLLAYVGMALIGWFVIILPWRVLESYYTLPFTFGMSLIGGVIAGALLRSLPELRGKLQRTFVGVCSGTAIVSLVILGINNNSNTRLQLAYDHVNARMVKILSGLPKNSSVLFNVPQPLEYVSETKMHLQVLYQRNDILVDYFTYRPQFVTENKTIYVVTPVFLNQILPSVRNSIHEGGAIAWNNCLEAFMPGQPNAELIGAPNDKLLVFDIGLNRLLPSLGIGDPLSYGERPWIDSKRTAYGWKVYHLPDRSNPYTSPGSFSDGVWILGGTKDDVRQVRFGQSGDIPLTGDWDGDGLTDLGVFREDGNLWLLDINQDGNADFEYVLGKPESESIPVVGDWDGNGIDSPGWYDPIEQSWYLYNQFGDNQRNWPVIQFGMDDAVPLVGDWDGDGRDTPGVVQPATKEFRYIDQLTENPLIADSLKLPAGKQWVPANWFGEKMDTLAIIGDNLEWTFLPGNRNCIPPNPYFRVEVFDHEGTALAGVWGN
ncbi:MAG: VCBS repeat-containing protein [Anaerolineales bacterium]|nr:VCBS repeat-containing protein [Anaerolineales bacterium]